MSSPSGPSPAGEPLPGSAEQHAPATSGPDARTGAVPPGTAPAGGAPAKGRRPWGWIAVCVLLLLVAGGFAVWALGLQSDLDDQKTQTAQAQQEGEQANEAVSALSAQVDDISQAISDAGDQLAQSGDDAQGNVQLALDGSRASWRRSRTILSRAAGTAARRGLLRHRPMGRPPPPRLTRRRPPRPSVDRAEPARAPCVAKRRRTAGAASHPRCAECAAAVGGSRIAARASLRVGEAPTRWAGPALRTEPGLDVQSYWSARLSGLRNGPSGWGRCVWRPRDMGANRGAARPPKQESLGGARPDGVPRPRSPPPKERDLMTDHIPTPPTIGGMPTRSTADKTWRAGVTDRMRGVLGIQRTTEPALRDPVRPRTLAGSSSPSSGPGEATDNALRRRRGLPRKPRRGREGRPRLSPRIVNRNPQPK